MIELIVIIFAVIFCILLLDFALIGYLPKTLNIWPALDKKLNIIIDDPVYDVQTNFKGKFVEALINNRPGYKSVILTPNKLFVKNTRMTYLLNIDLKIIVSFAVRDKVFKHIVLISKDNEYIFFRPQNYLLWKEKLNELGIKEDNSILSIVAKQIL